MAQLKVWSEHELRKLASMEEVVRMLDRTIASAEKRKAELVAAIDAMRGPSYNLPSS